MDKRSNVLQLVEDNNEQSLKELITKHGASVLTAPYEHKDNEFGWPSFGVSFVLFKMSGSECRCVCVRACACVCMCVCVYMCVYVCICMRMGACMCVYVCVYVCVCVCRFWKPIILYSHSSSFPGLSLVCGCEVRGCELLESGLTTC